MKKELYRNDTVAVIDRLHFLHMIGTPEGAAQAARFVREQLSVGNYTELQFCSAELAAACKEELDDIVTVRTSVRRFVLDTARFSPQHRLAEAYTLEQETRRVTILLGVQTVSDCHWDEQGEMWVYTAPAYREMGLGTIACKIAVAEMLGQGLEPFAAVRRHQYPAAALVARVGFVQQGEEPIWGLCKEAQ